MFWAILVARGTYRARYRDRPLPWKRGSAEKNIFFGSRRDIIWMKCVSGLDND